MTKKKEKGDSVHSNDVDELQMNWVGNVPSLRFSTRNEWKGRKGMHVAWVSPKIICES